MQKATIKDVAKIAGVSPSTVSRVISGNASISEQTCQKVRDAAQKLGYIPNTAARNLRCDKSKSIGVILPDMSGEFYSLCASSLLKYARKAGYTVLFTEINGYSDSIDELNILLQYGVDGIIFIGGTNSTLIHQAAQSVPVVTGDTTAENIPCVIFNNRATVKKLTTLLYKNGFRKFLYLGETFSGFSNLSERYAGFTDGLSQYNNASMITMLEDSLHSDKLSTSFKLFTSKIIPIMPEVIITSNDLIAQGIISAAHKTGISIPKDIAVTGFDDMVSSAYYTPSVTTIRQNGDKLSMLCMDKIIKLIENKPVSSSIIEQEIIIRDSAAIKEDLM